MPPTLKDSSTPPISPEKPERASETPVSGAEASSAQPVALEVPVKVNGARSVEGSEKREPFSETTSTVLVFANGAVIRLSASVAPGQLLFLTNDKTKKEVVCQVVKSKNYRSASGYVELEFTEPVLGFWGMRFPGDRNTAGMSPATPRKSDPVAAVESPKNAESKVSSYAAPRQPAESVASNLADAVQEFKTDIKPDSRPTSKADFLTPTETTVDGLKLEANRLQEQLSALVFAEQRQNDMMPSVSAVPPPKQELGDAAAKILEMADDKAATAKSPAPTTQAHLGSANTPPKETQGAAKSSFESEELKIPAWLEPLARNASVHAPPEKESGTESTNQLKEWHPEVPGASSQNTVPTTTAKKPASTPKHKPSAAVFGNSLLGEVTPEVSKPRGSGKGIGLAIAAGLILAAAGGAWYFRDSLGLAGAARNASQPGAVASTMAPVTPAVAPVNSTPTSAVTPKPSSENVIAETPAPISSATQGKVQAAAITERIPKANPSGDVVRAPAKPVEVVEPEIKRPSLGTVRLAKPKIGRSSDAGANSEMEPALELSGDTVSAGESSLGANFAESSKQPAAPAVPVAVGGDVKPARMISSVAPIYPALAKAQHVAGEVRIDALVEANGRVTTMKVVSGPSLLHQAAMDALRQWKYQPAMLDGKPVSMHLTVTIQFRLQ